MSIIDGSIDEILITVIDFIDIPSLCPGDMHADNVRFFLYRNRWYVISRQTVDFKLCFYWLYQSMCNTQFCDP